MHGTIVEVAVHERQHVRGGVLLAVVEAMKMENPLRAPHDGWVADLAVAVGDGVAQGAPVCRVDPMKRYLPSPQQRQEHNADNVSTADRPPDGSDRA